MASFTYFFKVRVDLAKSSSVKSCFQNGMKRHKLH